MVTDPQFINPFRGFYDRGSHPKFDQERPRERGATSDQPNNSVVHIIVPGGERLVELNETPAVGLPDARSRLGWWINIADRRVVRFPQSRNTIRGGEIIKVTEHKSTPHIGVGFIKIEALPKVPTHTMNRAHTQAMVMDIDFC